MKNIVVVGSLNMDLVLKVDRLPKIGETLQGDNINYLIGGKGSNQAVAAARLKNNVSIIGAVGADTFGDKLLKHIGEEKINIESVKKEEASFTGIATIFKTPEDNSIVVIPGANDLCDIDLVEEYRAIIKNAEVLVTQFEIPTATVKRALAIAKEYGVKTIVNPAPAKEIDDEILNNSDFITPNETEFEIISNKSLQDHSELEAEMIRWQNEHSTRLIVTRGSMGVSFVDNGQVVTVKCIKVEAVDTTGAGDTFNGALAHCIANKIDLKEAVDFSSRAASLSVTKFGAQTGMPTLEEVNNTFK
ncbi:MAG: ribokinase [Clostridium sp.]|uniref:ribokinase n=1 Tax=Clostridium sp. TaxID=1506 RepID=UPI003062978D